MKRLFLLLIFLFAAAPAAAQQLPALSGRIVDQADLLPADREAALSAKLEQLERDTSRQLVVVTLPTLQGYPIEEFGIRLGEQWKLGSKEADNGAILLIAPAERQMRIEVGDGLEPILTDAMSWIIIRDTIRPRFKAEDYAGGIEAGTDAIIEQLQAPPEIAEQKAIAAARQQQEQGQGRDGGSIFPLIFWGIVLLFIVIPMITGRRRGRRYRRGGLPIFVWGPGSGGGWGGGSSGGGFGGFGGGGGFSGGGGSFGGGGASGGW